MKNRVLFFLIFCLALMACNLPRITQESTSPGTPLGTPPGTTPIDLELATVDPGIFTIQDTATLGPPTETVVPAAGSIAGGIYGYPYGGTPGLVFVAFNQENSFYWYWIVGAGQSYYGTDAFIPPGKYLVVAYDSSGHKGGCTTIAIVVSAESATCDITDWGGSYPSKPGSVPSP